MATRRKTTTKKKTTRRTPTRKTTRKVATGPRARTKSQIFSGIAEETGLTRKDVAAVFECMTTMIKKDLGRSGPGTFTVPGLLKIKKRAVPRKPARKNVWLPLLNEFRDIPAKPASKSVRCTPLKALKEMV